MIPFILGFALPGGGREEGDNFKLFWNLVDYYHTLKDTFETNFSYIFISLQAEGQSKMLVD